jgi:hypothetical protein
MTEKLRVHFHPWPKQLGDFKLQESVPGYAWYEKPPVMSFTDALEIAEARVEHDGLRPIVVKYLQNNGWGKRDKNGKPLTWFRFRTEIWPSVMVFFGSFSGMTYRPKHARKLRPVKPMADNDYRTWEVAALAAHPEIKIQQEVAISCG